MPEIEILYFIFASVALLVIAMMRSNNIILLTLFSSVFSLFSMLLYVILDAPDVAMTEAAISSLILIFTIYVIKFTYPHSYIFHNPFKPLLFILSMTLAAILIYAAQDLPSFGAPEFNQYYLQNSIQDTGVISAVASILASYRGYDTMLETLVILVGGFSVLLVSEQVKIEKTKRDMIITLMSRFMLPIILLFALYIQAHGEISPGGGFQAGSIIATICIMLAMSYDSHLLLSENNLKKFSLAGVSLYFIVGLIGVIGNAEFLNYNIILGQSIGIMIVEYAVGISVTSTMLLIYLGISRASYKSL